jgi:phosphatidate cytidylyltransferase
VWLAPWAWPLAAGVAIALAGFLGDLNLSAVKRDAGVKDSSRTLPGMGGVLDRIDSLTLTAPVFYWLIVVPTS